MSSCRLIIRPHSRNGFPALVGALLLFILPAIGAAAEQVPANLKTVTVPIQGICIVGLTDMRQKLKSVKGIAKIEGSLTVEGVQVTYSPEVHSPDAIAKMIAKLGYTTGPAKTP